MVYNIFSIFCMAALLLIVICFTWALLRKDRNSRIEFLRTFKKGKCAIIYLVAVPLYWLGQVYAGTGPLYAIFTAISETMTLVVLRYDAATIMDLMSDNMIYAITVYFCFVLVAINAMLFTFSLVGQRMWLWSGKRQWQKSTGEKLLLIGNNQENIMIYKSAAGYTKCLTDCLTEKDSDALYAKQVYNMKFTGGRNMYEQIMTECIKYPDRKYIIVINTKDDEKNISIWRDIIAVYKEYFAQKTDAEKKEIISDLLHRLRVYVYGDARFEAIYNRIVDSSDGSIRYINKYSQIAMDFIDKYPLTQFMGKEELDYNKALLKGDVNVNVSMIGFGKTNRQIFLMSTANNQFMTETENGIELQPVHYHIFDKENSENNKNLNHNYYRYKNEFDDITDKEAYLPLPALPAKEHYHCLDINDPDFYRDIRKIVTNSPRDVNYMIIAFGTDLENIDLAQKLLEKKSEWKVNKLVLFVKVRSGNSSFDIFKRNDCFLIGDEKQVAFNVSSIDDDRITRMAKMRNKVYDLEYEVTRKAACITDPQVIADIYKNADYRWHIKKTQIERESNLYGCLSIRFKLHLMGLDYVAANSPKAPESIDEDTYMKIYAGDDMPSYYENCDVQGKKIVQYSLDFPESKRKNYAVQEHYRWNSFMISKGIVPATKQEIYDDRNKNGKDYVLRRHGNLTTFDGLIDFRKLVATRNGSTEHEEDVIKYDYQLMDDVYWFLEENGYLIIKR